MAKFKISSVFIKITMVVVLTSISILSYADTVSNKKNSSIDRAPIRVVVLNPNLLDDVMLLGIKPVGYAGDIIPDYLKMNLKSVAFVGPGDNPSTWDIFYLSPDLIIGEKSYDKKFVYQLQKMAPTMLLNAQGGINAQIENLKILGITFKQQQKAKEAIENFKALLKRSENLGQAYPATTLMMLEKDNQLYAVTNNTFASKLLKRLGKDNVIDLKESNEHREAQKLIKISLAEIKAKDPDQIILLVEDADIGSLKPLLDNPKWKDLKAVKYHHVYYMDKDIWLNIHGLQAIAMALTQANKTGFLALEKFVMI
ncbi:MAG: hypothetical protein EP298_09750 [Gammaproteobacteria bacterium]|nr:MAG: hypothetical protein EP298_09750 [Gammaproteobacteria bacterium]UTW42241.1 ABC transporter substrate-binding protein [bacterium SCSIO 12844]